MAVRGWAKSAAWRDQGSELTVAAAAGATVLNVEDITDFDDGETLEINGRRVDYTTVDEDSDTVTLAAGLTAAAAVDDRVLVVTGGQVASDYVLYVDHGPGDPAEVVIPFGDRDLWPEGDYDEPVQVLLSDDLERIEDVPGRTPQRDGAYTYNPLVSGYLATNTAWPDATWKAVGWTFEDQIDVPYDSATKRLVIAVPGIYHIVAGAVFASNDTGRRGLAIWLVRDGSTQLLRRIVIPADGLTGTEGSRICRLYEGDQVYVEAFQSSGAALDLVDRTTNVGLLRVSP